MEESTKRARQGREGAVVEAEEALDAELWGRLQDHIPLHTVYEKLPLEDRLRLRFVCKAWNRSALQRLEPKPYFVTIAVGHLMGPRGGYLNGLVKYDVASGEFGFERQPFYHGGLLQGGADSVTPGVCWVLPREVEGLILCRHPHDALDQLGVYSVHTKMWHAVPPAPETSKSLSLCGMMVDTSERPYAFKLVVGSVDKKTQIYDSRSRSWSTTSSIMLRSARHSLNKCESCSCMCHDGCVYMSMGRCHTPIILAYSMKEDSWSTLDFPAANRGDHNTLGVWEGRIFTTREDNGNHRIVVWELVDPKKQEWVEYGRCSVEEYDQLLCYATAFAFLGYEDRKLVFIFCDEYLLIYNWLYNRTEALIMFNLKTKKWTPVGFPKGMLTGVEDDLFGDEEMEVDDEDDVDWVDDVDEVDEVDGDGDFDDVEDVEDAG